MEKAKMNISCAAGESLQGAAYQPVKKSWTAISRVF
jgi:hypothetical protein